MIQIVNLSRGVPDRFRHRYEVSINGERICTYTHLRANGLAECLKTAAAAVEMTNRGEDRNEL